LWAHFVTGRGCSKTGTERLEETGAAAGGERSLNQLSRRKKPSSADTMIARQKEKRRATCVLFLEHMEVCDKGRGRKRGKRSYKTRAKGQGGEGRGQYSES